MAKLSDVNQDALRVWESGLQTRISTCASIEQVAQRSVESIYDSFRETVVLARFFATIPLKSLPVESRRFVAKIAELHFVSSLLHDDTLVLTLLGTRGDKAEWNSRTLSKAHVGVPLISKEFIDSIPMIARVLSDMGVSIGSVEADSGIETRMFGTQGGLFYVEDAASAVDSMGRKIISAQDFVVAHGVRTVFGTAGLYLVPKTFVALIMFTRDLLPRARAKELMPLANLITIATSDLMRRGKVFTA